MKKLGLAFPIIALAALAQGCSNAQDYQITGEVTSAEAVSGAVTLEFFEVSKDNAAERESVHTVELAELGAFTETVPIDPQKKLLIRALDDADGDGACTDGELWGETEIAELAEDGTAPEAVTIALGTAVCPTDPAAAAE